MNINRSEMSSLLAIMTSLAEWEVENTPLLTSAPGRHLYFSIAKRAILNDDIPTVKDVVTAQHITDRSLRTHLLSLVDQGYLFLEPGHDDARTKKPVPSEQFYSFMNAHVRQFSQIISNHFLLIDKTENS